MKRLFFSDAHRLPPRKALYSERNCDWGVAAIEIVQIFSWINNRFAEGDLISCETLEWKWGLMTFEVGLNIGIEECSDFNEIEQSMLILVWLIF